MVEVFRPVQNFQICKQNQDQLALPSLLQQSGIYRVLLWSYIDSLHFHIAPYSIHLMYLVCGKKLEYPEETCAWGELNQEPSSCEGTVLTTAPCCPNWKPMLLHTYYCNWNIRWHISETSAYNSISRRVGLSMSQWSITLDCVCLWTNGTNELWTQHFHFSTVLSVKYHL